MTDLDPNAPMIVAWLGTNLDGESEPFLTQRQAEFWANGAGSAEPLILLSDAEAHVKSLEEALRPFADAAQSYDPDEGDDTTIAWAHGFTIGSLRRARAALGGGNG